MKTLDPGHKYELLHLDGNNVEILTFVKREGEKFPNNVGHYEGTNCQEVLRVLIDRVTYLNSQVECLENKLIILALQQAISLFEIRAARRHGAIFKQPAIDIEKIIPCAVCGHIFEHSHDL